MRGKRHGFRRFSMNLENFLEEFSVEQWFSFALLIQTKQNRESFPHT